MAESFLREKLRQAPQKEGGKSCATFLLCDPGWYVHKPDVHNKWDDNTHTQTRVVVVVVSHIQRIGCQPEKTTLHGGQSRSWSAEQGKENKRKSLAAYPPPPTPHGIE